MASKEPAKKKKDSISGFFGEVAGEERKENAKKQKQVVATRDWLLGHITKTKKVRVGPDGDEVRIVEIRERLNPVEQKKFPVVFSFFSDKKPPTSKKKHTVLDNELDKFMAYIVVNPKLSPEDMNIAFSEGEKTAIVTAFFISVLGDIDMEAMKFFR